MKKLNHCFPVTSLAAELATRDTPSFESPWFTPPSSPSLTDTNIQDSIFEYMYFIFETWTLKCHRCSIMGDTMTEFGQIFVSRPFVFRNEILVQLSRLWISHDSVPTYSVIFYNLRKKQYFSNPAFFGGWDTTSERLVSLRTILLGV